MKARTGLNCLIVTDLDVEGSALRVIMSDAFQVNRVKYSEYIYSESYVYDALIVFKSEFDLILKNDIGMFVDRIKSWQVDHGYIPVISVGKCYGDTRKTNDKIEILRGQEVYPFEVFFIGYNYGVMNYQIREIIDLFARSKSVHYFEPSKNNVKNIIMNCDNAIGTLDALTKVHIYNVSKYTELLVRCMDADKVYSNYITKDFRDNMVEAARLHDIGKLRVDNDIWLKKGKLTAEEFKKMKEHTSNGWVYISEASRGNTDVGLDLIRTAALTHHERWDGSGYPLGLKEFSIPMCGRIIAVADVYDAISSKRLYKNEMSHDETMVEMEKSKRFFDPSIYEVFVRNQNRFKFLMNKLKKEQ